MSFYIRLVFISSYTRDIFCTSVALCNIVYLMYSGTCGACPSRGR
jgi:hypothetical protein